MSSLIFSGPMIRALLAGRKTQTRRPVKKLRVFLPEPVRSDRIPGMPNILARAGVHSAYLNPHGAVFMKIPIGAGETTFGLKPGEFHFIVPQLGAEQGTTRHENGWRITPKDGSRIWVRETWCHATPEDQAGAYYYAATDTDIVDPNNEKKSPWKSPLHLPRAASRIELEPIEVKLEKLNAISREDAIAEGAFFTDYGIHEQPISSDGGTTWNTHRSQRAGWSLVETTRHEQCLGSPQQAFGNLYNVIHAGPRWNLKDAQAPWDENPWVFAISFRVHRTEAT